MVLLSRVLHHDAGLTRCAAEVDRCGALRDATGDLAPWMAIELMAQCVAVHAGLVGRADGDRARAGLLLGARRVAFHASRLRRGQALVVQARHLWGRATGPVAFECAVADARSGALLAEGRLACVVPEDAPSGRSR
jgi:predicted hotdog family 3-hydroxylacyl-ACP dehydratase